MSEKKRKEVLQMMEDFEKEQREKGVQISPTWQAMKANLAYA